MATGSSGSLTAGAHPTQVREGGRVRRRGIFVVISLEGTYYEAEFYIYSP